MARLSCAVNVICLDRQKGPGHNRGMAKGAAGGIEAELGGAAAGDARVVVFASWEAAAAALTVNRVAVLRHLAVRPEPSVLALSRALGRGYRRLHEDVAALEAAGLLERRDGLLRVGVDAVRVEFSLRSADPAA